MSVTTSGFALETGMPVPISSGGSIEVMSGFNVATAALVAGLFAQTHEIKPFSRAKATVASISISLICLSEWKALS